MTFPDALLTLVTDVLGVVSDHSPMQHLEPVSGGCINNALRLTTSESMYLLKYNQRPFPAMFSCEARGLELLRQTQTVRVPLVLAYADATDSSPGFLLQEWIEVQRDATQAPDEERLGAELAALHRSISAYGYGLDHSNYIGHTPQANDWDADWVRFFRECRLRPQVELATRNGLLSSVRRSNLERLMERLDTWLGGVTRQPALIHGDLWSGNVLWGVGGEPALIDPAVSYSDREVELAFTELFGGFGRRFYHAYEEAWSTDPDRAERRDLYNLYHLLNHLNIFGTRYLAGVDSVVQRYVG